jgi:nitrogen regulatory protein PII
VPLLREIKAKLRIVAANIHNASGEGRSTHLAHRGMGVRSEKEVLSVVVRAEQADEVFEFIYHQADINRPHGGLIYQSRLDRSTEFTLPDLPVEE